MINTISKNMAQLFVSRDIIDFDDINIYMYGFQLLFSTVFKGVGLIIFGLMFGYVKEIIVFIVAFSSLRIYAGGYHSETYLECFLVTVAFVFIGIYIANYLTMDCSCLARHKETYVF